MLSLSDGLNRKVLRAGSSRPWTEVLQEAIGTNKMDATSLIRYFQPIIDWLHEQNRPETLGWPEADWVPPVPEDYPEDIGKTGVSSMQRLPLAIILHFQ